MEKSSDGRMSVHYFPEFKGLGKVLLFNGNREGFERLVSQFTHAKETGEAGSADWMTVSDDMHLSLCVTKVASETGVFVFPSEGLLRWTFTDEDAGKFIHMIQAVAESEVPCHQYLDMESAPPGCDVSIMISKGEYVAPEPKYCA